MKEIKRSELVKSDTKHIGLVMAPDFCFNDTEEVNKMEFIAGYAGVDFIRSNLFDISTDDYTDEIGFNSHELHMKALEQINNNIDVTISSGQIGRDGMFDPDEDIKILVLEYKEIKEYYLLFKELYEQECYKEDREKE